MKESSKDTIFEERQALMQSPTTRTQTLRTAHFLSPTANSITGPTLKLPSLSIPSGSVWPLEVSFNGWHDPQRKWEKWVDRMHSTYKYVWKKAGIYEALMSSTYRIRRNNEVVFGIAERWCSETNTFMFPWGEATITLEDMMVLGGFSVMGSPVSMPLETKEMIDIEENLNKVRNVIIKSKSKKALHSAWLNYFMECENELEHEAFLSLWLSRFVFPENVLDTINSHVFSIAIYLSRGIKIALAPTILANIYGDLGLLRGIISTLKYDKYDEESFLVFTLWSPLQFVQIWAWERFPTLQPEPKLINLGEPRLVRWNGTRGLKLENVRGVIDSAGESFLWRPYIISLENWIFPSFYSEKEKWVMFSDCLDEESKSFLRCLRVSELVGIDNTEPYLPHRVAMQFGMDQDLPGWIPRSNDTQEIAWKNYTRPIRDEKIYFPSRLSGSYVTTRYLQWWKKWVLELQCGINGVVRGKRSSRNGKNDDFPPGFHPKCNWGKRLDKHFATVKKLHFSSFTTAGNGALERMEMKPVEIKRLPNEDVRSEKACEVLIGHKIEVARLIENVPNIKHDGGDICSFPTDLGVFEIEFRISNLENVVEVLKTGRL